MILRLKKYLMLAAAAFLGWSSAAQVVDYGPKNGVMSFEDGTAPAIAGSRSSVTISDLHYKLGTHALLWHWRRPCAY